MKLLLLTLLTFTLLYPAPVPAAGSKNSVIGTDDEGYSGYRMITASGDTQDSRNSIYTHDDDGYIAQRVVMGAGSATVPTTLTVNNLTVGTCATTLTTGEIACESIQPCDGAEPVVIKLDSGSTATTLLHVKDKNDLNQFIFYGDGYFQAKAGMYSNYLKTSDVLSDLKLQLRDDLYNFSFLDTSGTERAKIDSSGKGSFNGGLEASVDWDSGDVTAFGAFTATGTPFGDDYLFRYSPTCYWKPDSHFSTAGSINSASSYLLAATYVRAGLGFTGSSITEPSIHPAGLETADGYGIGVGTTAPNNNGLLLTDESTAASSVPGTSNGGIYYLNSGSAFYFRRADGTLADLYISQLVGTTKGTVKSDDIRSYAGSGPTNMTYGYTDGTLADATITTSTTLTSTMHSIIVDGSAGAVTLTLPTVTTGQIYQIKVKNADNAITVTSTANIDWSASDYTAFSVNDNVEFAWCNDESTWIVR